MPWTPQQQSQPSFKPWEMSPTKEPSNFSQSPSYPQTIGFSQNAGFLQPTRFPQQLFKESQNPQELSSFDPMF